MSPTTHQIATGYWAADWPPAHAAVVRCVGPDGRPYVLRPVPSDCLHGDGLHPAIAARLARVRDLPHPRVATLAGVVRGLDGLAYAVWADVNGRPISRVDVPADRLPVVARGLAAAVELLHARGIVHGNLCGESVVVTAASDVWLTDVSPYLWDDPAVDVRAVADLLAAVPAAAAHPPPNVDGLPPVDALHALAAGWPPAVPAATARDGPLFRRRAAVAAAGLMAAAAAAAWVVAREHGPPTQSGEPVLPLVEPPR